jgi:hypothetical protein
MLNLLELDLPFCCWCGIEKKVADIVESYDSLVNLVF